MTVKKEQLKKLQDPKVYDELGLKPKWYPRQTKGGKAVMQPYYDSRDVQKLFDHVCGPENWQNEPRAINGKLYMAIGINVEDEGWIYKSDVGTESNVEKEKGEASDALKRAASMWGAFRHKYEMDEIVLGLQGKFPLTANGKPLTTGKQQTDYCNGLNTEIGKLATIYRAFESEFKAHPDALAHLTGLKEFLQSIKE